MPGRTSVRPFTSNAGSSERGRVMPRPRRIQRERNWMRPVTSSPTQPRKFVAVRRFLLKEGERIRPTTAFGKVERAAPSDPELSAKVVTKPSYQTPCECPPNLASAQVMKLLNGTLAAD